MAIRGEQQKGRVQPDVAREKYYIIRRGRIW